LLETIVHHIQQSNDTAYLYKIEAHAGILGNVCADAIASCSVEYQVAMISTKPLTPIPNMALSFQSQCTTAKGI
jgi:hypothetical protein